MAGGLGRGSHGSRMAGGWVAVHMVQEVHAFFARTVSETFMLFEIVLEPPTS